MWSTLSLASLSGPLWPEEVVPDKVLSMGRIELFDTSNVCKQITVCKQNHKMCLQSIYI